MEDGMLTILLFEGCSPMPPVDFQFQNKTHQRASHAAAAGYSSKLLDRTFHVP
jgi:hypothetical protein